MKRLLLLYTSRSGSTLEVASVIASTIRKHGIEVDIEDATQYTGGLENYDGVILGSPIYKGIWMSSLWRAVRRLETQFKHKPVWGFSLCIRALEPGGREIAYERYIPHNIFDQFNLQDYRMFAGRLANLSIADKHEFTRTYDGKLQMTEGDYRDWAAIQAWARQIASTEFVSVR